MDQTTVNEYLLRIREAKRADLPACPLITDAFIRTPPHDVGVAHLILRPRFLLGDPTGTGKTPQALVAYGYQRHKDSGLQAVVCTTQAAQFQWANAVNKFLIGTEAKVLGYERTANGGWKSVGVKGRQDQWADFSKTPVWITTYALAVKEEATLLPLLSRYVLMLDEGHALRSHRGETVYPAMLRLSQKARGVWGLTATPLMDGRLEELYAIMEIIRPGTFGSYSEFRKTFYRLLLVKPKWKVNGKAARPFYKVLGYQNLGLLQATIAPFILKRPVEEMEQYLPPIRYQQLDITLDPKQRGLYKSIVGLHWPQSETPIQRLAALTYAQMAVDAPDVLGYPLIPSAKTTELVKLLSDSFADQKVIVYAKYAKVVGYLSRQLTKAGIAHGVITGSVSATTREAARQRFQTDPAFRVILITNAGAQALDLQAAGVVIAYDLPWTPGELEQIVGRARRVGSQHAAVLVVLLTALHTIDEKVTATLTNKETTIRTIISSGYSKNDVTLKDKTPVTFDKYPPTVSVTERVPSTDDVETIDLPESTIAELFQSVTPE